MTPEEANKIIAEFMGWEPEIQFINYCPSPPYVYSLDALVPVWEKLEYFRIEVDTISWDENNLKGICFVLKDKNGNAHWNKQHGLTIQEAAAIATAKAIQEQEKEK